MCCGLEWDIGVVGVQNICKIGYNGIQLCYSTYVGNSEKQYKCTVWYIDIPWDRRNDLGYGAVIILNMLDGVGQFSDILVHFEFSSDS